MYEKKGNKIKKKQTAFFALILGVQHVQEPTSWDWSFSKGLPLLFVRITKVAPQRTITFSTNHPGPACPQQ